MVKFRSSTTKEAGEMDMGKQLKIFDTILRKTVGAGQVEKVNMGSFS